MGWNGLSFVNPSTKSAGSILLLWQVPFPFVLSLPQFETESLLIEQLGIRQGRRIHRPADKQGKERRHQHAFDARHG